MAKDDLISKFKNFVRELKRRRIFRVVIVYSGVSFITLQVAALLVPALKLPNWTMSLVFILLGIGFIIAVISAWAFDITHEGIVRITDSDKSEVQELRHGGKPFTGDAAIVGLLVIIIGIILYQGFFSPSITDKMNTHTLEGDSLEVDNEIFEARLGQKSIAVIPFSYLAAEDSADYFSLGMTDELLSRLAEIKDLAVIGRTSVMQYQDTDKTLPEIGRELGVAHLLEGSVQLVGDQVRIQAQLIDASDGTHLWAETYNRKLKNILELQSEVTIRIARSLEAELLPRERTQLVTQQEVDEKAYQLYLQGRHLRYQETGASLSKSVHLLRRSLQIDSTFAPAWATLSTSLLLTPSFGGRLPQEVKSDSLVQLAAMRALALDSTSAEAHIAMGHIHYLVKGDFPAAGPWLKRAVELKPGLANAHREYGLYLASMARFEVADHFLKTATRLDPTSLNSWINLGWSEFWQEKYRQARRHLEQALTLEPDHWMACIFLAEIYLVQGQPEIALQEMRRAAEVNPSPWSLGILGSTYARVGRPDSARTILKRMHQKFVNGLAQRALIYASLGEVDQALDLLEKVGGTSTLKVGQWWEPLHDEPRYQRLLERMGLDEISIRRTMNRLSGDNDSL